MLVAFNGARESLRVRLIPWPLAAKQMAVEIDPFPKFTSSSVLAPANDRHRYDNGKPPSYIRASCTVLFADASGSQGGVTPRLTYP